MAVFSSALACFCDPRPEITLPGRLIGLRLPALADGCSTFGRFDGDGVACESLSISRLLFVAGVVRLLKAWELKLKL